MEQAERSYWDIERPSRLLARQSARGVLLGVSLCNDAMGKKTKSGYSAETKGLKPKWHMKKVLGKS